MSLDLVHWILVPILLVSMTTRATLGFGEALIAMPLLTLTVGLELAAPLVAFNAVLMSASILAIDRRRLHIGSAWRLLVGGALGVPLGLLMLEGDFEGVLQVALGLLIIGFSVYKLVKPDLLRLDSDGPAFIAGFFAGFLGGMYNTAGPPLVVYGTARRFPPEEFRVTLQGYFLPGAVMVAVGHGIAGRWTPELWSNLALSLPILAFALVVGTVLNRRIPRGRFDKIVYGLLIVVGVGLIAKTIAVP